MICGYCRAEIPEGSAFCPYCGAQLASGAVGYYGSGTQPKVPAKKKGRGLKIGLITTAAVLLLAVAAVALWVAYFLNGPMVTLALAAKNTLDEDNLTIEFEASQGGDETQGVIQMDMNARARELSLYAEFEGEDHSGFLAVYDGYAITGKYGMYFAVDIQEKLDDFFRAYEGVEQEDSDWSELLETIMDHVYVEAEEHLDFEILETCAVEYFKTMNDVDWLEKNAGFSERERGDVTYYIFQPDSYNFVYESLIQFEDAFREPNEYEALLEELEAAQSDMRQQELDVRFGIDDDELTEMDLSMEADGQTFRIRMEVDKIGETDIDTNKLAAMLDQAIVY